MSITITPTLGQLEPLHADLEQLRQSYQKQRVTAAALQTFGKKLWEILALKHLPQQLIIHSDSPLLHDIPWETLYHPTQGFLALSENFHFIRQFSKNTRKTSVFPINCIAPLRILLFTAQVNTSSQQPLLLEVEQMSLRITLAPLIAAGKVYLYAPDDGRFSTLDALLRQSWSVVILSGHGGSQRENTGFWFEDEQGNPHFVTTAQLQQAFRTSNIACVVIAACQSLPLAMSLYQLGIPHVVGMWETLLDRAACRLIQTLCTALVQETSIQTALYQARVAMTQLLEPHEIWHKSPRSHYPDIGQWCLPMLFSQDTSQPIIKYTDYSNYSRMRPPAPTLFIGRRQLLRELSERLRAGNTNYLWLWGAAGVGKTALARQLVWHLSECGFQVIYHATESVDLQHTLQQYFDNTVKLSLERLHQLTQNRYILWIEGELDDIATLADLEILARWHSPYLRIILSSRRVTVTLPHFHNFQVPPIDYQDFYRYLCAQGLPYLPIQLRLIYQATRGNFHAMRLLENFPMPADTAQFWHNMAILQRYWRSLAD
jgi:hypothetical protein